jgi:uridine kinase
VDVRRRAVLLRVVRAIEALPSEGVRRVAIDGVDGAGKTTLADELGDLLTGRGTTVVRASIDGFHQPRERRWARGRDSPLGYYLDSYDYPRARAELIDPLAPHGSRRIRRAVHDVASDLPVCSPVETVPDGSVLVVDGIFLHRPELADAWDLSVFVHVTTRASLERCAARDGTSPEPEANRRYVEGQRLYLDRCRPRQLATVVIDNTDLAAPDILDPGEGRYATRE